ncbi:hypothetical protein [Planomonospora algeriensis]
MTSWSTCAPTAPEPPDAPVTYLTRTETDNTAVIYLGSFFERVWTGAEPPSPE